MDAATFDAIFSRVLAERSLAAEPGTAAVRRNLCLERGGGELRVCHPKDIIDIVTSIGAYEGLEPKIGRRGLERAASIYVMSPSDTAPTPHSSRGVSAANCGADVDVG